MSQRTTHDLFVIDLFEVDFYSVNTEEILTYEFRSWAFDNEELILATDDHQPTVEVLHLLLWS